MSLPEYRQRSRAKINRTLKKSWFVAVLFLAIIAGIVGLVLAVLAVVFGLGAAVLAGALIFIAWSLTVGSFYFVFWYLERSVLSGLSAVEKQKIGNRLDFNAWTLLERWSRANYLISSLPEATEGLPSQLIVFRLGADQRFWQELSFGFTIEELFELLKKATPKDYITDCDILNLILSLPRLTQPLERLKVKISSISSLVAYYNQIIRLERERDLYFFQPALHRSGGFARDWSVSYTTILDQLTTEVSPDIRNITDRLPLGSRQRIIDEIITAMTKRRGQNILLIGRSGSGKGEILRHLAGQITNFRTKTRLDGIHVRYLNSKRLTSLTADPIALQRFLDRLFSELVRAGSVALIIDDFEQLLRDDEIGTINIAGVLESYLEHPNIHIFATMNSADYATLIRNRGEIEDRFTVIELPPPTQTDLFLIILSHLMRFEQRHGTFFTVQALETLVNKSSLVGGTTDSPQKELDLLETIVTEVGRENRLIVTENDVLIAIEKKTGVPQTISGEESSRLLNLSDELHQRVVGQGRAIDLVSEALMRARAGLTERDRPIGTFLFLGSTGVGKTETAKALAEIYFGSQDRLIRLDMTEYATSESLDKLLGQDERNNPGSLTIGLTTTPSAVVLFDEIEKADLSIRNVLLQVLDEGRLTTNYGLLLDLTNTICIATSNAGSDYIREKVLSGQSPKDIEKGLIDSIIKQKIFSPEFLNRFDAVAIYSPLSVSEIREIAQMRVAELSFQIEKDKGVKLTVSPAVIEQLVAEGYDPVYGARAMARVVKSKLVTAVAKEILNSNPSPGSTITINSL